MVVVPRPGGVYRAYAWQAALFKARQLSRHERRFPFVAGSL